MFNIVYKVVQFCHERFVHSWHVYTNSFCYVLCYLAIVAHSFIYIYYLVLLVVNAPL